MDADWAALARAIKKRRKELRYSQVGFAEAAGVSRSTLQHLERVTADGISLKTIELLEPGLGWASGSIAAVLRGGEPTLGPSAPLEADEDWAQGASSQPDLVAVLDHIVLDLAVSFAPDMTVAEVKQLQARALETARRLGLKPHPERLETHNGDDPES